MQRIARSLRQHRELSLNYFRAQELLSSGSDKLSSQESISLTNEAERIYERWKAFVQVG